jgi:hypothetical protein
MTTATPRTGTGPAADVVRAARIQLVNWKTVFGMPWAVVTASFLVNVVIFASVPTDPAHRTTGGLASLYGTMMFANLITVTQYFPYTLAMSVTRRAFVSATVLVIAVEALADGVLLSLLRFVESGTGGWNLNLHFFDLPYVRQDDPLTQALVFATPLFVLSMLCMTIGSLHQRWGATGLWATAIGVIVAAGLVVIAITDLHWTHALGSFFTGQPAFAMLAVYPLAIAALLGLATTRMLMQARV